MPFRRAKAAIKLQTMLDLRDNIPSFIHITDGKTHEANVLDDMVLVLVLVPVASYQMDRVYLDFARLNRKTTTSLHRQARYAGSMVRASFICICI